MRRYKTLYSFREGVSRLIDAGRIDTALCLVHDFVERIITEPLCTTQVYGSKALDDLCLRIGKTNLARIKRPAERPAGGRPDRPTFVYIVTMVQRSGGHTRVLQDFIRARPYARHVVLSTELAGRSDADFFVQGSGGLAAVAFERAPRVGLQRRLTWLQGRLLEIRPTGIYLFNHHQDSVAVAAVQPEMDLDACFYHHGDHHLCLGVFLPHFNHVDAHPVGYHNCRDTLGIDNGYIPLTADDKGDRPADMPFMPCGTLTTCTAAGSNKIEAPYFISYLDVVPKLLAVTGGRHIHIGKLTPRGLLRICRGMTRCGVRPDRFVYIPWVPSVWKALHEYRVDLYLTSFPYGGALTLIEAMGAGTPVALHRRISSRILSGIDIAYPGAFSWRWPDELLEYCASVTAADLPEAGRRSRTHYEGFYSGERLPGILEAAGRGTPPPPALVGSFSIESDEYAVWVERQLSLGRLVKRAVYRALRRLRARWR
jgi:hypothetical protein